MCQKDVYINVHMVIIMNNADLLRLLLRLLMIYIEFMTEKEMWRFPFLSCSKVLLIKNLLMMFILSTENFWR